MCQNRRHRRSRQTECSVSEDSGGQEVNTIEGESSRVRSKAEDQRKADAAAAKSWLSRQRQPGNRSDQMILV